MVKRALIVTVLLMLMLAACQSQATPSGTAIATQELESYATQSEATGEVSPVPPKTEASVPQATGETAPVANCTVVSISPTPNPTEQSLLPPAGEADWVVGPETAAMTIFEYSDFQ